MNEPKENLREYVERWKRTGKFLEKLRREEIRRMNLAEVILSFDDASRAALIQYPPKPTSGLIEMQKILKKSKKQ